MRIPVQKHPLFTFTLITVAASLVAGCAAGSLPGAAQQPDANRVVSQFEANNGHVFAGYRVNHAKGLCVAGYFQSNGGAAPYSSAPLFAADLRTPVIGRFSIPGGNPEAPDSSVPVRGMALAFLLPDGSQWRTAMINAPVFQIRTPQAFYQLLQLRQPDPATGKPDLQKLHAFMAAHPDTQAFSRWAKATPPSASFATQSYNSLEAFELVDAHGARHAVRWSFVPQTRAGAREPAPDRPGYLAADLQRRLSQGPLQWSLVFTFAQAGDPVADSTQAWPADRQRIDAGTLVLESSAPAPQGACRDVDFNPLTLPRGIEPSADPMIAFRSHVYQAAVQRRTQQEAQASAGR